MDWKKIEVEVKKGKREGWWLVKVVGKEGKELKFVMKRVEKFFGEEEVEELEEMVG